MSDHSTLSAPSLSSRSPDLRLGFVRLTDAAPLLVAQARGLFGRAGLSVSLAAAASWSALRDRLAFGAWDGAPVLAPMPIAAAAGLGGVQASLSVTATLGRNGNCVVIGGALLDEILAEPGGDLFPLQAAVLARVLAARRRRGAAIATFAVVFPFSAHNYLLRHWLAAGGIDPDQDVRLVVLPPPVLPEALAAGEIDGFCSGEPWGSRAVELRVGRIALASLHIWPNHPEKLLAFNDTALRDEACVVAATSAVIDAMAFLAQPENQAEAAHIVHDAAFTDVPLEVVALALSGQLAIAQDSAPISLPDMILHQPGLSRPDIAQAHWFAAQMRRWGHLPHTATPDIDTLWRTDLWARAASQSGIGPRDNRTVDIPPDTTPDTMSHWSAAA